MDHGEPNNNISHLHRIQHDYFNREHGFILDHTMSEISISTMVNILKRFKSHKGKVPSPNCTRVFHDMHSANYRSLLPGWLCEERTVQSGRLYKYYYGPDGRQYQTYSEVQMVCRNAGIDLNEPKIN